MFPTFQALPVVRAAPLQRRLLALRSSRLSFTCLHGLSRLPARLQLGRTNAKTWAEVEEIATGDPERFKDERERGARAAAPQGATPMTTNLHSSSKTAQPVPKSENRSIAATLRCPHIEGDRESSLRRDNHSDDSLIHRIHQSSCLFQRGAAEHFKFDSYGLQARHSVMKQLQLNHWFALVGFGYEPAAAPFRLKCHFVRFPHQPCGCGSWRSTSSDRRELAVILI
jgi:hypothetical protein